MVIKQLREENERLASWAGNLAEQRDELLAALAECVSQFDRGSVGISAILPARRLIEKLGAGRTATEGRENRNG